MNMKEQLMWALARFAQINGIALDKLQLQSILDQKDESTLNMQTVSELVKEFEFGQPFFMRLPDPARMPAIAWVKDTGWGLLTESTPDGRWRFIHPQGEDILGVSTLPESVLAVQVNQGKKAIDKVGLFSDFTKNLFFSYKSIIFEVVLATFFINFIALGASFFSMQVYDRVIPTRSENTLFVLALGVVFVNLLEMIMKSSRSKVLDLVTVDADDKLSRLIFHRLLSVRVDQMPGSVGSLAAQMRAYEQIRSFFTSTSLFALVDIPFSIFFVVVIASIASPLVAIIPVVCAIIAISLGLIAKKKIDKLTMEGAKVNNLKTGLLVEAIEGVETIKAGSGGWKFLSRWLNVTSETIVMDLKTRHTNENLNYRANFLQQISYVALICMGAYVVMAGNMTTGALVATSILGGRILSPIMMLPSLIVQHSHAKAAMEGLDKMFELKTDHHDVEVPLTPEKINGHYALSEVGFTYADGPVALKIPQLQITPGERVAILGPIGSGKSTLLRLLTGLYKPQSGRVLMDGLDLSHISRHTLSQQIGYLQQDTRLFQGTLRENLLIGTPDPGDDVLQAVLHKTGLIRLTAGHPKGLELPIMEGGKGLSGGQRQLVAFTRLVLTKPQIWLLDEPTASMDNELEQRSLAVLAEEIKDGKTLIVVTHKPSILPLVNRIIIVSGNQVVMDGPRDVVLAKLQENSAQAQTPAKS